MSTAYYAVFDSLIITKKKQKKNIVNKSATCKHSLFVHSHGMRARRPYGV